MINDFRLISYSELNKNRSYCNLIVTETNFKLFEKNASLN